MSRSTSAVASHRKKKKILKRAKGFWGDRKNHHGMTKEAIQRALAFNYIHRKQKKRDFRRLWITRITAAARINGISYSKLISGLAKGKCLLDRKALSEMAIHDPNGFAAVAAKAKEALV